MSIPNDVSLQNLNQTDTLKSMSTPNDVSLQNLN
jgi:hypothetical protein